MRYLPGRSQIRSGERANVFTVILDWPILNNRRENARSDHLGAERFFAAAAAIISLAAVASSYFLSSRTLATSRELSDRSVWQKANESELNNIQQRIERFYNPNKQISEEIRIFSRDLRSRTDQNFVLLRNLFDRHWVESLDEGRRFLLDSIVEKAEKLDEQPCAVEMTLIEQSISCCKSLAQPKGAA